MKKILLLAAAALMLASANAQLKRSETTQAPARPQTQLVKPQFKLEEKQMRTPGTPVFKAPKKASNVEVWYRRPAGAFPASVVVEEGAYAGSFYAPYIWTKPYCDYTFNGYSDGEGPDAEYVWDVQYWGYDDSGEENQMWEQFFGSKDLTMQYGYEVDSVPFFYVVEGDDFFWWNVRGFQMGGTQQNPVAVEEYCGHILSIPSPVDIWDYDILVSSKTMPSGGRNGDNLYSYTYYSGAEPYGNNESGYWFGKNGGIKSQSGATYRVDGIAQAFEKPEHPYLLKQVVVETAVLEVAAQVDMTCKIYKLDEIPPYQEDGGAYLPDEPGELIAMGRATLTPETEAVTGGMVFFTLFGEEDGLEYDITPTIDCPILVVIDGYNDPEMENLTDFSALISSDDLVDEGFGELAYLKFGYNDEEGNLDYYVWEGLNNFFSSGTMMTGLTIFLSIENPYLTFNYTAEDGKYTFPIEGGVMEKQFGNHTSRSIEFWSWVPSADDAWFLSCNDDEVPEWLNIELEDQMEGDEFTGLVNAVVTAEPLPEGMQYREAVVRFEFPGAYIDYTFMQGTKPEPQPYERGDVNGDGEISIADVNALISVILGAEDIYEGRADVNGDNEITLADVNALIDIILNM